MAGLQVLKAVCNACGQRIHVKTHRPQKVVACPKCQSPVTAGKVPPALPATPPCPRCSGFMGDRRGDSLACVDCGFQVGAPKVATVTDPWESPRQTPRPSPRPSPTPKKRGFGVEWILSIAALLAFALLGFGAYWWVGQPSAAERQASEDFLRTGEELMALQKPIRTPEDARRADPEVMAKAREHADAWQRFDAAISGMGKRRKEKLRLTHERRASELMKAAAELIGRPYWVFVGRSETGGYVVFGGLGGPLAKPSNVDVVAGAPPKSEPFVAKPAGATDAALLGSWKLDSAFRVFTGREKAEILVAADHRLVVDAGVLEISGPVGGQPRTLKYSLELTTTASPKQFRLTNMADPADVQEGIYLVRGDELLMRILSPGPKATAFDISGVMMTDEDRAGDDSTIPAGFLLKRGETGRVLRYLRPSASPPSPAPPKVVENPKPKALDLEPIRRLVAGKWSADGLNFEIDAAGKGFVNHIVRNADSITGYLGDFVIADRDGKPTIAYTLSGSGGRDLPFLFRILPATTATELVLEESEARMGKNPFVMRRPGATAKPAENWQVVEVPGDKTACVVCESGGFYSGYGGKVAITLSLGSGQATAKLDEPGSLWIVGKGGVTWKGVKLPEGSFAEIDREGRATRMVDKYRASIEISKDTDLLSKAAGGKSLARVPSGTRVQLLVPANDPKGLHQVRLPDGKEGWLAATWTDIRFERKVK